MILASDNFLNFETIFTNSKGKDSEKLKVIGDLNYEYIIHIDYAVKVRVRLPTVKIQTFLL